jgi:riboflavin biosynthesis pyrimidine reductase
LILEEVFPSSGEKHEIGPELQALDSLYPQVEGLRFNHVISSARSVGNSDSASNEIDRALLRVIRSQSNLIITSGKTARDENLNASSFAPMLILTRATDPLEIPATTAQSTHTVYVTQRFETDFQNPKAIAIGTFQDSVTSFTENFCNTNSVKNSVLETGLEIASQFANADLLTEIDLTVTRASDLDEARSLSESFLASLGVSKYTTVQILKYADTWFFRFSPAKANH